MTESKPDERSSSHDERFAEVRHLSDAPVEDDDFAGGAHARTARALVDTILSDNRSVRAIGLEGSWGSGKSSVIEIARKHLEQAGGIRNIMYSHSMFGRIKAIRSAAHSSTSSSTG